MVLVHTPVRQDDDVRALSVCPIGLDIEMVDRLFQRRVFVIEDRDDLDLEPFHVHVFDL